MAQYYLDTEFHEFKKKPFFSKPIDTIELISIGIVSEEGEKYYAVCKEFDIKAAWKNEWLRENVLKNIHKELCSKVSIYGRTYHSRVFEPFTVKSLKFLLKSYGKSKEQIGNEIYNFINPHYQSHIRYSSNENFDPDNSMSGPNIIRTINEDYIPNKPEFWAYFGDYDWTVFCWIYGRMIDLPSGYPMYCKDLKQLLDEKVDSLDWYYGRDIWSNTGTPGVGPLQGTDRAATFKEKLNKIKELEQYPTQDNEHNALDDADWNRILHKFMNESDIFRNKEIIESGYNEENGLVTVGVPIGALVLSPNATPERCERIFSEWMQEVFSKSVKYD